MGWDALWGKEPISMNFVQWDEMHSEVSRPCIRGREYLNDGGVSVWWIIFSRQTVTPQYVAHHTQYWFCSLPPVRLGRRLWLVSRQGACQSKFLLSLGRTSCSSAWSPHPHRPSPTGMYSDSLIGGDKKRNKLKVSIIISAQEILQPSQESPDLLWALTWRSFGEGLSTGFYDHCDGVPWKTRTDSLKTPKRMKPLKLNLYARKLRASLPFLANDRQTENNGCVGGGGKGKQMKKEVGVESVVAEGMVRD